MKYFLHDSSAFQDEKITELYMNFGYEGVGLFFTVLEKLSLQEKPIKTIVLKKQLNVGKKLEKCWNFMESLDILSSNNGETFNKQLLNFSEKYMIKKEKNKERIANWRSNNEKEKNVTCYKSVRNTPKDKISKVKVYIAETSKPKIENANAMRTQCERNAIKESKVKESKYIAETSSAESDEFDSDQWVCSLMEDKRKHVQLIGYYFKEKKLKFPSKKAGSAEIGRWSKDAIVLIEYSEEQILKSFKKAKEKHPEMWNLHTLRTVINEII